MYSCVSNTNSYMYYIQEIHTHTPPAHWWFFLTVDSPFSSGLHALASFCWLHWPRLVPTSLNLPGHTPCPAQHTYTHIAFSCHPDHNWTLLWTLWTHRTTVAAVLHVGVVVVIVPHTLNAQEVAVIGGIVVPSQRVNEKVFLNVSTARQHQHPTVHPQSPQWVSG